VEIWRQIEARAKSRGTHMVLRGDRMKWARVLAADTERVACARKNHNHAAKLTPISELLAEYPVGS